MTAYEVTPAHVPPYPGAGLPAPEVARILHRLDPAALREAGAAHTALGRELGTMAAQLTQESQTLAQHWSGTAARRALAQFQRLHTQTATLAAQATRTGAVLTWLGTQVVPAYRDPASGSQAQQYLTALSAALARANATLPPEIGAPGPAHLASAAGPTPSSNPSDPTATGNSAVPGDPAPAAPIGPASLMGATGNTPGGPVSPTNSGPPANPGNLSDSARPSTLASPEAQSSTFVPTATSSQAGPAPLASRLQSVAPDPASSASAAHAAPEVPADPAPSSASATEAPAPLISRLSFRPARARQPAAPRPVDQDSGLSGGAVPLQPAPDPTSPAALTAAPTPASRNTPGALPMAGGVSSQPDHERRRESWAPEDRNPWGLPDTCVPPLIEGT